MKKLILYISLALIFGIVFLVTKAPKRYKTKKVLIVVIDGPRYTETWGDPLHKYIPRLANELAPKGNVYTSFYNNGPTYTNPGHTAITTGNYENIANNGTELPQFPSIFQNWIKKNKKDSSSAWIVASKDKLQVLSDCKDLRWSGKYRPATNCGVAGLGSGYRNDSITYKNLIDVLSTHQPEMVLVNFREPDYSGHKKKWNNYLKGITQTDQYIYDIWNFIENDPFYKGSTTMFVTNDHGRHLDGIKNGFVSHGDKCEGCRHINLFACGPDFKEGAIVEQEREMIDIPATIAELMDFDLPNGKGEVMKELFEKYRGEYKKLKTD